MGSRWILDVKSWLRKSEYDILLRVMASVFLR